MADMGFEDMDSEPTPSDETPMTEEGMPEANSTITIPSAMLAGREPAEGDTITMKVVAVTDDGVEVAISEAPEQSEEEYPEASSQIDEMAASGGY